MARELGLNAVGLLSILLRAKAVGLLAEVQPVIESLRRDAQFWISDQLLDAVLHLAGESH
ncbi:MAG: DUF3368 domain-containing protein [Pedosphaera sp.]|nr:DUF3368 domain-containing protein [Pedosphaera sp.]